MDSCKELVKPKTLSKLRYATAIIWIVTGGFLFSIFFYIESGKKASDIRCDAEFNDKAKEDLVLGKCFDDYQKKYNKFPVYGFVLINFSVITIVSVIYSQLVRSKVNELETREPDVEGQQGNLVRKGLFTAYCYQLAAIIILAILSIILLQTHVFRPSINFPSNFICNLSKRGSNSSAFSSTNASLTKNDTYSCRNTRATEKFGGSVALTVFNGICAFLAFIELVWIFSRARNGNQFMEDSQFFADHLRSNRDEAAVPLTRPELRAELQKQSERLIDCVRHDREQLEDHLRSNRDEEAVPLNRPEPRAELQEELERLKDRIIQGTEQLEDLKQPIRPKPGEGPKPKDLELDKIFVKLILHDGIAGYDFPKDRREQLKVFPKPKSNQSNYVPMQDIFDGHNKRVLFVGRPGIGKTILSTRLLRESALNAFKSQNFDAAFLVKFRRFNSRTDLNLREMLSRSETVRNLDDKVWNYIIKNPTKVLLIFDGVDEYNARSEISNDDSHFHDLDEERMPLHCLYKKIASGTLLKGATVITTSRPTAVSCLKLLTFDRVLEILGFTSDDIEKYVNKFIDGDQNPKGKKTIWQHIRTNINLFTLCYVPVNCFIICSCLSWLQSQGSSLPTKLTKIYSIALKIFYFKHGKKCRQSQKALNDLILKPLHKLPTEYKEEFQKLGEIAFKGLQEGRLQFSSEEVKGLEDCGMLHRLRDQQGPTPLDPSEPQYCFIHLTCQEFLAAYHVVHTLTEAKALQKFISDHIDRASWQVVVQFLAGLLADSDKGDDLQNSKMFIELLPKSTLTADKQALHGERFDWRSKTLYTRWPNQTQTVLAVTLCKCLHELGTKHQSLITRKMKEIGCDVVSFSFCQLAPVDCASIVYFLKNLENAFELVLHENTIGDLGCWEIKKWIVENDCNLEILDLSCNLVGEKGVEYLSDALKHVNCKLTNLALGPTDQEQDFSDFAVLENRANNNIGDRGAQHLCNALKDVNCKLTELNLGHNNIENEGVKHLSDVLKEVNCKLLVLNLESNQFGDKGTEHLSYALRDVNCKLIKLNLHGNKIGQKGAEHLSNALKDVNCKLQWLNLGWNKIGDKGAKHLCNALKVVNCKLEALSLRCGLVGDKGVCYMSDALKNLNCKLTLLDLTVNEITEKGAEHLGDALKDVNCKLTLLRLRGNPISESGQEHLRDACKHKYCELDNFNFLTP